MSESAPIPISVARRAPKSSGQLSQTLALRSLFSGPMRTLLARFMGGMGAKRDYYDVFGWDRQISGEMMLEMYHRGGISERIIHAYPDAIWANPPDIYSDVNGSDEWTSTWKDITSGTNLWEALHRADRLARLGRYAIILVGTNKGNLEQPLRGASEITFLQPYSELAAKITGWETDPTNPRFGMPAQYTIYPDLAHVDQRTSGATGGSALPARQSFRVHASRVIHVAQGVMEDEVFGTPMLGAIWNYLTDLQKVVGGSAESYWLTANRGMQVDVDKDMELSPEDAAALTAEVDEYSNQMRRVLRTRGVDIKDLGSKVADPRGPYTTLLQLISGTTGIPQRILLGSEAGHLASTQDKGNWAEQVENMRALASEPRILRPMLQCFQNGGLLPPPTEDVIADWPDAYRPSPNERADMSSKIALAANNLGLMTKNMTAPAQQPVQGSPQRQPAAPKGTEGGNQGQSGPAINPNVDMDARADPNSSQPADTPQNMKPLLDRQEMRAVLGFSTDNAILKDTPLGDVGTQKRVVLRASKSRGRK